MNSSATTQWEFVKKKIERIAAMDRTEIERNTLFQTDRRNYDAAELYSLNLRRKLPPFNPEYRE